MTKSSGQILVLALVILGLVLINTLVILSGSLTFFENSNYSLKSDQSTHIAEAAMDKALASLNASGGSYAGEQETSLGDGSFSVSVNSPDNSTKIINATAYIPNKSHPVATRTFRVAATKGIGAAFNYGVQVGNGGLEMLNGSEIHGSVYSNGDITMSNNSSISGDAYVAGGVETTADQANACVSPSCTDFIFGKDVGGQDILDIAQSFKPSTTNYLIKASLNLKKVGSPPDLPVYILKDSGGMPDKNNVLAQSTLTANLVTSQYGFVEIAFATPLYLTLDNTYWIVVDTSANTNNYWSWSADLAQGYSRGMSKWSPNWQASGTPVWNTPIPGNDLDFKIYLGGIPTYIQGTNGARISGDAHAHTLSNLDISGGAYYQVKDNITAASYHPGTPDPAATVMPISDSNISLWKDLATSGGIFTGNISSCRSSLGPGKYVGNVSLDNGCTVTIKDPVWITGNLTLSNNVTLKLDSAKGGASGVLMVDGLTSLSNNIKFQGSGADGSFLMLLSNYDSRVNGQTAINVANGGNAGIFYAPVGIINISNNNHLKEVTGWKIILGDNVEIEYESGLSSVYFTSGPSGSYTLVKGSYQIK